MTVFKYFHTSLACRITCSLLMVVLTAGCDTKSDYQRLLEKEMNRNVRFDSLFFGLQLGMTKKDFYSRCWELNSQGIFHQGTRNTTVLYKLMDLGPQVDMDFYPHFKEDRVVEMPVYLKYTGWAPWNEHLYADSLKQDIIPLLEDWYGEGFIPIELANQNTGLVKIDGNRRILVTVEDDVTVKALFSDMTKINDNLEGTAK